MTPREKAKAIVDEAIKGMTVLLEVTGNNRHFAVVEDAVYIGSVTQPTMATRSIAPSVGLSGKSIKTIPLDAISTIKVHQAGMILMEFVVTGTPAVSNINDLSVRLTNENLIAFPKNQLDRVQQAANQIMELRGHRTGQARPDVSELLKQLAGLKEAGVLSEAEFEEKKRGVLAGA